MHLGKTALSLAVERSHKEIAKTLLEKGARDTADSTGTCALVYIATNANFEMASELLSIEKYYSIKVIEKAMIIFIGKTMESQGDYNKRIGCSEIVLQILHGYQVSMPTLVDTLKKVNKMLRDFNDNSNEAVKLKINLKEIRGELCIQFEKERKELLLEIFNDRENVKTLANGIMVTAALFATVAFTGFLNPPGGSMAADCDEFPNGTTKRRALVIFFTTNSLSFYFAVATVVAALYLLVPKAEVPKDENVKNVMRYTTILSIMLILVILVGLVSFASAGFVALPEKKNYKLVNIVTCCIGCSMCIAAILILFRRINPIRRASRGNYSIFQRILKKALCQDRNTNP